jgi:NDP-hexose-3-ketoreductase
MSGQPRSAQLSSGQPRNGPLRNGPLRLGVLGAASIARRKMLPAVAAEPGATRLAAVASRELAKARALTEEFGGEPVAGYEELLRRPDIDAVYVPLPAAMHAPWIEAALHAGKHVLAEKPLVTRAEDAYRLVALADKLGLVLAENFMFTLHSQHAAVRALLADGVIGEVRGMAAAFTIPALPDTDIRYQPDVGGGALADVGGYPLRAAALLLAGTRADADARTSTDADADARASASTGTGTGTGTDGKTGNTELDVVGATLRVDRARGVDLSGAALLAAADGTTAHVTFGMEHAYRAEYEVWGTNGRVWLDRAYTPPADHVPVLRIQSGGELREQRLAPDDQFRRVVRAFAAAVSDGTASGLQGDPVLRQADLVRRVRDAAVISYVGQE